MESRRKVGVASWRRVAKPFLTITVTNITTTTITMTSTTTMRMTITTMTLLQELEQEVTIETECQRQQCPSTKLHTRKRRVHIVKIKYPYRQIDNLKEGYQYDCLQVVVAPSGSVVILQEHS